MKRAVLVALWASLWFSGLAHSHDLGTGQTLFMRGIDEQSVKTPELSITLIAVDSERLPFNRVILQARAHVMTRVYELENPTPFEPSLVALNQASYCGQSVIFLTLRYPVPMMADIQQHLYETHSFSAQSLEYLATADVPFEEIALMENGVELGFEYTLPQKVKIECTVKDGDLTLTFE